MVGVRGADLGLHGDDLGLNGDLLCSDGRRRERDLSRGGDCVFCFKETASITSVATDRRWRWQWQFPCTYFMDFSWALGKRGVGGVGMWNQGAFRGVRLPRVVAATFA